MIDDKKGKPRDKKGKKKYPVNPVYIRERDKRDKREQILVIKQKKIKNVYIKRKRLEKNFPFFPF